MWDERQRTQKIGIELERVKRTLREQDDEVRALMAALDVSEADVEAAGRELAAAPRERRSAASHGASEVGRDVLVAGDFTGFVLRG